MATNFVQKGTVVTVPAPTGGVVSDQPVLIGTLFGVATHDAAQTTDLELAIEGVFNLPADTALTINVGDRVFWDAANGWVDETSAAQVCVGVAVAEQDTVAETVWVKLGAVTPAGT